MSVLKLIEVKRCAFVAKSGNPRGFTESSFITIPLQSQDHPFLETIGFSHSSNIHQDSVKNPSLNIFRLQNNILTNTNTYRVTKIRHEDLKPARKQKMKL